MHHPNSAWVALPWGLPFQKLVAVPFSVQHPYHPLQPAPPATSLITVHQTVHTASVTNALTPAIQTFVPATFSVQPQPLTIRQVRNCLSFNINDEKHFIFN